MQYIAFTGPRTGLNEAQAAAIESLISHLTFFALHGDCVGSDASFDAIARRQPGLQAVYMYPASDTPGLRAFCSPQYPRDVVLEPEPALERNRVMVDACTQLIAVSKTPGPVLRSGTWATIRYAQQIGRPAIILLPSGAIVQ